MYAFIKFYAKSSLSRAVDGENGRKMGNFRIRVHPAKHDKNSPSPEPHHKKPWPSQNHPTQKSNTKPPLNHVRDQRSYKDVFLNKNLSQMNPNTHPSSSRNNQPYQSNPFSPPNPNPHSKNHKIPPLEPELQPDCFKFEPNMLKKVSSRILGDVCTMENEEFLTIKGSKNSNVEEVFSRSVIATTQSLLLSNCILDHILMEGVTCLSIKPLWGIIHLVTFETIEYKKAMTECEWLNRWFMDVRNVNSMSSAKWRETQLRIYGMPLHGWGSEIFYKVGCILGRVTSVDYSSFEYDQSHSYYLLSLLN